jgi:uncharacterized protein (DUF362 family)
MNKSHFDREDQMRDSRKLLLKIITSALILTVWFYWDFSQANKDSPIYRSFKVANEFDDITSATAKVSIIRSDDSSLPDPISITDDSIHYAHIEQMVRRAVELAGGFQWLIESGNMVLLKPNIVDPEPPGTGEVTDVRVIKALVKIIDEIDPGNIEIVIGEGSPREMDYELPYAPHHSLPQWKKLWDIAGYQDLKTDPYLSGINFRLSNLNGSPPENPWQDLVLVEIPGGGVATPQGGKFYVHKDVLNADVFITVPVMKIHTTGITVALKNQIGVAPSTRYGFSKTQGVPQDNYQTKLIHEARRPKYWTDEEIVDLSTIADIDFVVVDAIACLESYKTAQRDNQGRITNLIRMNCIIAGSDPVAVDHVCTRLMELNPDDIDHITLAERVGLGTNDPDIITIVGADLEQTKRPFKKRENNNAADFGQSNREWILRGPFSISGISDPIEHPFLENEADLSPAPGMDNWSEAVFFFDDRIDLNEYFNNPNNVIAYAFSYFDAPNDQQAELWVGSDEAIKIFINGNVAYNFKGNRVFSAGELVSEKKVFIPIKEGENRLLVKVLQKYGYFDFSLNVCEPESDPDYDGNRVWRLKFRTKSSTRVADRANKDSQKSLKYDLSDCYPNPFNHSTQISFSLPDQALVDLSVYNIRGETIKTIFNSTIPGCVHRFFWDGTNDNGEIVTTGVYFVTLRVNNYFKTKKVLFVR